MSVVYREFCDRCEGSGVIEAQRAVPAWGAWNAELIDVWIDCPTCVPSVDTEDES